MPNSSYFGAEGGGKLKKKKKQPIRNMEMGSGKSCMRTSKNLAGCSKNGGSSVKMHDWGDSQTANSLSIIWMDDQSQIRLWWMKAVYSNRSTPHSMGNHNGQTLKLQVLDGSPDGSWHAVFFSYMLMHNGFFPSFRGILKNRWIYNISYQMVTTIYPRMLSSICNRNNIRPKLRQPIQYRGLHASIGRLGRHSH